jgi:serine/threonine protein kinase
MRGQGRLPAGQVKHVLWSLMMAMKHLLENKIVHGDIKPENVIFSIDNHARLSDFGCACRIEECNQNHSVVCFVVFKFVCLFVCCLGTAERFRHLAKVSPAFQSPEFASGQAEEEEVLFCFVFVFFCVLLVFLK